MGPCRFLLLAQWREVSVRSHKYHGFRCDQNGPSARREEGAYLNRYVTDEQRGRRPILIATKAMLFMGPDTSFRITADQPLRRLSLFLLLRCRMGRCFWGRFRRARILLLYQGLGLGFDKSDAVVPA